MTPPLSFDNLFAIFSLLPSLGLFDSADMRLYNAMEAVALTIPLTDTKDLTTCIRICKAWNSPAQRFLMRDIRVVGQAQCTRLVELTSNPEIGDGVRALEIISGSWMPRSPTPRENITLENLVALLSNCRCLRTLLLIGFPQTNEDLSRLTITVSFDKLVALGLSRSAVGFSVEVMKQLLDRMPRLRALAFPGIGRGGEEHLPLAPKNQLWALVVYSDSLCISWLLNSSTKTLTYFDPEFHTQHGTYTAFQALMLVGHTVEHLRVNSGVFVPKLVPACPNLRHLAFPILEMPFERLLSSIINPLESLTLWSNRYLGHHARATLSPEDVRTLIDVIETKPTFSKLKLLDLSLSYHKDAYPQVSAEDFTQLKEVCTRRGIRFPCPDVLRLISGPDGMDTSLY